MTIQIRKAERLTSATEFTLVKAALAPALRKLDGKQLAAHVTRARRARDKYRDLLKRQRLSARERTGQKSGRGGDANARTREKAELFQEVLQRFEARVEGLGARDGVQAGESAGKGLSKGTARKKPAARGKEEQGKVAKTAQGKAGKATAAKKKKAAKAKVSGKAARRATKEQTADEAGEAKVGGRAQRKTPVERVAEKVRNEQPRTGVERKASDAGLTDKQGAEQPRSGVGRKATDPGVTDKQGARFVSDRAKVAAQQDGSHGAREQAIQGHVGSTGRRNQAKRDKR